MNANISRFVIRHKRRNTKNDEIVGILKLSDIFEEVCGILMEHP